MLLGEIGEGVAVIVVVVDVSDDVGAVIELPHAATTSIPNVTALAATMERKSVRMGVLRANEASYSAQPSFVMFRAEDITGVELNESGERRLRDCGSA